MDSLAIASFDFEDLTVDQPLGEWHVLLGNRLNVGRTPTRSIVQWSAATTSQHGIGRKAHGDTFARNTWQEAAGIRHRSKGYSHKWPPQKYKKTSMTVKRKVSLLPPRLWFQSLWQWDPFGASAYPLETLPPPFGEA